MIYLGFALKNPFWSNRHEVIRNRWFSISENKTIELNLYKTSCLLKLDLNITGWNEDHSGVSFSIGLTGYNFEFVFYDNRHRES